MSALRRILGVVGKDLVDALRDGRVIVALVVPIAVAVLYNATAPEQGQRPGASVAVLDPQGTGLATQLERATRRSVELDVRRVDDPAALRRAVRTGREDLGVRAGQDGGRAEVLVPDDASATARSVADVVPDAVTAATGREPAAQVRVEVVRPDEATQRVADAVAPRELIIAGSVVLLIGFVALLVVPLQTAEELETGTFGALRLAMSGTEVLAAKALVGVALSVAGTALVLAITRTAPEHPLLFAGAVLALTLSMVGFGVLLGLLSRNATQINTYSSFLLFPVVGLAGAVLFVDGGVLAAILDVLPFSRAMELLVDGLAPGRPFDTGVLAWVVVLAWAAFGAALLVRTASRREV